jgi:hypothetical protein
MSGYSPAILDFDNDGWKDLFVSGGHVQSTRELGGVLQVDQHNAVFRNLHNGEFQSLVEEAGLAAERPKRHRGAAFGDLNGDGRLDAVVTALADEAEIWINESENSNHWLALDLEGTESNRGGTGAVVRVIAGGVTQYNHLSTSFGYASSSAGPLHFGLGAAAKADVVEITWPSGTVQTLENVPGDQVLSVTEPRK